MPHTHNPILLLIKNKRMNGAFCDRAGMHIFEKSSKFIIYKLATVKYVVSLSSFQLNILDPKERTASYAVPSVAKKKNYVHQHFLHSMYK